MGVRQRLHRHRRRKIMWPISSTDRVALSEGVDRGSIPRWVTTSQRTSLLSKTGVSRFFHALRRCSFSPESLRFPGTPWVKPISSCCSDKVGIGESNPGGHELEKPARAIIFCRAFMHNLCGFRRFAGKK